MVKKLLALALALWPTIASAQDLPAHSIGINQGPGVVGQKAGGPCAAGQALVWAGGVTVDPSCGSVSTLPLTNTHIYVGNAGNIATDVALSGDCTITNAGVITCTKSGGTNLAALAFLGVGTGLISSGGNLNINTTTVVAATYGDATHSAQCAFNAQGQATGCSNIVITPAFSSITGTPTTLAGYGIASPLPIAQGGTAQATAVTARQSSGLNAFGDQGSGYGDTNQVLAATDRLAYATTNFTASRTWTLPAANVTTQPYLVRILDFGHVNGANTLVVTRAGADTINGGTSVTVSAANGGFDCYSNGSNAWACSPLGSVASGGVTSVTAGTGLTGGTITTTGTVAIDYTRNNSWSGDVRATSGDPWCDVKSTALAHGGAVGNGSTDDTNSLNDCVALLTNGGTIYLPPGTFCAKTGTGGIAGNHSAFVITHASATYILQGSGTATTAISACGADVNPLFFASVYGEIRNIAVIGKGNASDSFGATYPALRLDNSAAGGFMKLSHIHAQFGSDAIYNNSSDSIFDHVQADSGYSQASIHIVGNGSRLWGGSIDQSWPTGTAPAINTQTGPSWAAGHAYTGGSNDVVLISGCGNCGGVSYWIQHTNGNCTSAGGIPNIANYSVAITDNTCQWKLAFPNTYSGILLDSGSGEEVIVGWDFSASVQYSLWMTGTARFPTIEACTFGNYFQYGIRADSTSNLFLRGNHLGGAALIGGASVLINTSWSGPAKIIENNINNGTYGIRLSGGQFTSIRDNFISSTAADGILVDANVSYFNIEGNMLNTSAAITITAGASDYYNVIGNILGGNACSDGGTGIHTTHCSTASTPGNNH